MRPRSLKIFEKKKGIYLNPEQWIGVILTISLFLIAYLEKYFEYDFNGWITILAIIWFIYIVGILISNFFRYESENGEYSGKLTFWEDRIQIGNKEYNLEQIKKIEFINAYDIKGMFVNSMLEFSPHLSNGLDNQFLLILKNGERIECNFLQTDSEKIEFFNDIFIHYHKKGIVGWLQLLDILNIEDYDKIQEFKKEITIANNV
jgi:hypothetical protein